MVVNLAIGDARTLVLPHVLARRIGRVVNELPEIRAVAPAHLLHRAHCGDELHAVFDRHQHGAAVGLGNLGKHWRGLIERGREIA
jgi:hypothetical protein